jgi:hypothetical protein
MKTTLLIAAAAVLTLTSTATLSAAEPIHSPRGKANQIRIVADQSTGKVEQCDALSSPRHAALKHSLRKVKGAPSITRTKSQPTVSPRLLANEPWRVSQHQASR